MLYKDKELREATLLREAGEGSSKFTALCSCKSRKTEGYFPANNQFVVEPFLSSQYLSPIVNYHRCFSILE